ncbi:MAG: hypothetical protein LJE91_01630 [Gammaproteobacteria bacterium]|jgi:hypothetical protein|nr:hypothetical protein [Gammaproteobacteria bacterium]
MSQPAEADSASSSIIARVFRRSLLSILLLAGGTMLWVNRPGRRLEAGIEAKQTQHITQETDQGGRTS